MCPHSPTLLRGLHVDLEFGENRGLHGPNVADQCRPGGGVEETPRKVGQGRSLAEGQFRIVLIDLVGERVATPEIAVELQSGMS